MKTGKFKLVLGMGLVLFIGSLASCHTSYTCPTYSKSDVRASVRA